MIDIDTARILVETDCLLCDATGRVMSDDWRSFMEWRSRRPTLTPEDEDDLVEQYFLVVCDYQAVPAASTPCEACGESGRVKLSLTVRELLEVIFEHVERPLVSEGQLDELAGLVKKAITSAALASQGLADGGEAGTWLRAVQEGAEALRSLAELRAHRNGRVI